MHKEDLLANKVIIVTGGGSGLGFAMAAAFLKLGASVAICGRNQEKLVEACDSLKQIGPAFQMTANVRDFEEVSSFTKAVVDKFGKIDGLVNNAAGNFYSTSEDLSPNGFKAVIETVLNGSFHFSKAVGSHWIESSTKGAILNIVTTYSETGSAFVLPSACAKAGVSTMTKTLAYEWAHYGIRVNGLAPGPIPTKGAWKRLMPNTDFEELYKNRQPYKRFGTPQELTDVAAFLLSDLASYINGAILPMDGGEHLQGGEFNFMTQLIPRDELRKIFASMKPKK